MMLFLFNYEFFFFFNDTATTEIYTLSLHDALPIFRTAGEMDHRAAAYYKGGLLCQSAPINRDAAVARRDRKSTRLNSSHGYISYAVFCLKKKTKHRYRCASPLTSVLEYDSVVGSCT